MKPIINSARVGLKLARTAVLIAWFVLLLAPSVARAQQSIAPKRVLVLYWYGKDFPANVRFDRGFQAALQSAPNGPVEYYPEYLETDRFPGENQSEFLHTYLRRKYADRNIDVIVAAGGPALEFLLKNRDDLFTHTPIVFVMSSYPVKEELAAGPGLTGIVTNNTYRKTLDLALRLHPGTDQVFIISGTLEHDKRIESLAREELQGYESRVRVTYLTDLAPDELIAKMKNMPERSIVLYVWQQSQNEQGRVLESADVLALIARSAPVPIYGMSGNNIGRGIVGGYVFTTEGNATRVAEIALRIANGARAQYIPVENAPTLPMFDWRELRRWGISEDMLPPGYIVQFRERSFWKLYKWRIVGVVSLCIVETLLIFALLAQRARRRRVEEALRDNEERLKLALSAAHMGAWDWRIGADELNWSDKMGQIFGLTNGKPVVRPEAFLDLIHPDDRPAVTQAITRTVNEGAPYDVEFRTVHQDGSMHWVMSKGKALSDKAGQAARMLGVNMDITDRKRAEERLWSYFELPLIGMAITSPDRRFVEVNQKLCDILGYSMDQLTGMSWTDVTHPDDADENIRLLDETLRGATEGYVMDKRFIHRDGHTVYASISARCTRRADRTVDYLALVVQEITERKQAEEALRLSEDKFSKAFRSSPDAFAISRQADGMILEVNGRWEEISGYARDEAVGRTVSELQIYLNPSQRAQLVSLVRERGSARDFEVDIRKKSGEIRNVSVSAEPIMIRDEPCLMLIVRDITERKRAEQSLRESEEALRKSYARIEDLAGRLIVAQEDERRHIARELHDDLNQQVAALAIGISRLKRQIPDAGPAVQEQFTKLREKTDWLSERIRQVSHELHCSILQHVGLPAALNSYCAEFSDREGIAVTLDIRDGVEAVSSDAALCLYRVAQESLRNIARHSGARSAIVALTGVNCAIELRVADQGVGFDPGQAREGRGLGLVSMEERVKLLHGNFVLTTQPGAGTELRAQIPLRREHEENKGLAG